MDSTTIQTVINIAVSAGVALITTFGAIPVAQRFSKRQSLEQIYDEKLEELQVLYIETKTHIEAEVNDWWIAIEHGSGNGPVCTYVYPIDKIVMLAERYEPSLSKDLEQVKRVVSILRSNNDPESYIPEEAYYYQYILNASSDFSKADENLKNKFKEINQKYAGKGSSSLLLPSKRSTSFRFSNQGQIHPN
ncbi:MAG: hypothetical protein NVS4B11_04510 [Ktedonobacteraceae bacterium]